MVTTMNALLSVSDKTGIVELAQAKAMGARGLRAVLERAMFELMYDLPSRPDVKECTITRDFIEAKGPPTLIHKKKRA